MVLVHQHHALHVQKVNINQYRTPLPASIAPSVNSAAMRVLKHARYVHRVAMQTIQASLHACYVTLVQYHKVVVHLHVLYVILVHLLMPLVNRPAVYAMQVHLVQ